MFLQSILDAVFPPRCAFCGATCQMIHGTPFCFLCAGRIQADEGVLIYIREYPELAGVILACQNGPELRRAIHALKYKMYRSLSEILADKMRRALENAGMMKNVVLVPVPLYFLRRWWRGFNQAEDLARIVADQSGLEMNKKILKRARHTRSQMKLSRAERLSNLQNAFIANPSLPGSWRSKFESDWLVGKTVVLIDDVVTTGATLGECARALQKAGARKVYGLVLSRGT